MLQTPAEFGEWYSEVIRRAELIDDYEVGGCFILRPDAYLIWEQIQSFFDGKIKALGERFPPR